MAEKSDEIGKEKLTLYIESSFKKDVDNLIMDKRIRNFQSAYREIFSLGVEQFKKRKKED